MKPLSSCALFGATRVIDGIQDALCLQHSVVGCQWGSLAFRYAGKPYDVQQASTVIYENDVIEGGEELLRKALQQAEQLFPHCGAVFVVSGCVPNMIGDDVEGVLAAGNGRQQLVHIKAPGYAGNIDSGVEAAYLALLPLLQAAACRTLSINILGIMHDDPYAANDMQVLQKILGSRVSINCNLQSCTLEQIQKMPQAALNICFGYGEPLAKKMQERFGVPYINCAYPYGVGGMQAFLQQLEAALGVDLAQERAELEKAGRRLVYRCADYLTNLFQMPTAVVADKAHLVGMKSFLEDELGMRVVLAADSAEYSLDKLEADVERLRPVLLCGSSFLKQLSEEQRLPLLRFVYPLFDQICLAPNSFLGVQGAAYIIEQIVNACLQQEYKGAGLYAPLREELCGVRQ